MVDFQPVDIICDLILGPNLWDAMHTDDTQLSTMGHRCAWGIPVAIYSIVWWSCVKLGLAPLRGTKHAYSVTARRMGVVREVS